MLSLVPAVVFFLAGLFGNVLFSGLPAPIHAADTGGHEFHMETYALGDALPGDIADARVNRYVLEHFYLALTGHARSFLQAPFFYPWVNTIAFSDTHWGDGIVYAGLRMLGMNPESAFVGWFIIGFLLNFISAYFALRFLGLKNFGAAAGAFLFTFCIPMSAQDSRAQLVNRYYIPLAVCAFHRFLQTRALKMLTLTMMLVALQLLATIYMGVFLAYFLVAYALAFLLLQKPQPGESLGTQLISSLLPKKPGSRSEVALSAFFLVSAIGLTLLFAIPYMEVKNLYGFGYSWMTIESMLPRIESYFLADRSLIWFSRSDMFAAVPMRHEHQLFLGMIPLLSLAYALGYRPFLYRHPASRRMLYALAIVFFFTLSLNGASLYRVLTLVPGISAIRGVARIILVAAFFVAFVMGEVIDSIWSRTSERINWKAAALVVGGLLIVENTMVIRGATTRAEWYDRVQKIEQRIDKPLTPDSILVVASSSHEAPWLSELDAMFVAQKKGIATLNGYSGNYPPGWKPMRTCQDVVDVVRANGDFRVRHRLRSPAIDMSKLVLVGFDNCRLLPITGTLTSNN